MTFIVSVYLNDRAYGGPEEGGWYYDCGDLVRTMRVFYTDDAAWDYCCNLNERLKNTLNRGRRSTGSVLSTGRFLARVTENTAPSSYPAVRPHYE